VTAAAQKYQTYQSHFLCKFLCVKCILLDLTFSLIFWFTFLHTNEASAGIE